MAQPIPREKEYLDALSTLVLNPSNPHEAVKLVAQLTPKERVDFLALADSNHVIIRCLSPVRDGALLLGDADLQKWAVDAIEAEKVRIANALKFLSNICTELENAGCATTVIKSLDHWPDMGNDLDLYTTGDEARVQKVFTEQLKASIEERSWGDRIAQKWNFAVPGLRESVEVHVQRLGQMGEHTALARRFVTRRELKQIEHYVFQVPAPEERIIAATLQRMYRHFYFRVCDIANTTALVESGVLDFTELRKATEPAGIWPGVASFLVIVSDYVKQYRGRALDLPKEVTEAALGPVKIEPRARFLRVAVIPHGAALYTRQVTSAAFRGDIPATFRLGLLPYLGAAAAFAYKLTGSDKGVW